MIFYEHFDYCVVCLTHITAVISINALNVAYAFYKHEGNLELITTANLLVRISSIMLEWSRRMMNMLLYENGEILTLVSIGVTLASSCHGNANSCQYFSIFLQ